MHQQMMIIRHANEQSTYALDQILMSTYHDLLDNCYLFSLQDKKPMVS